MILIVQTYGIYANVSDSPHGTETLLSVGSTECTSQTESAHQHTIGFLVYMKGEEGLRISIVFFFFFLCMFCFLCVCSCSPLRSCPERPGPQVVLCLGMRNEVRNGVCLCSSRYAKSSRWAELVAVCVRDRER